MSLLPPTHIVVLGNEKGGTGKSTVAMHLAVGLLGLGYKVACLDLDGGQGTLSRYLANRRTFGFSQGVALPSPEIESLIDPGEPLAAEDLLTTTLGRFEGWFDVIVMDSPGSAGALGRIGHAHADTLITPMNDSFVDLDVLAEVDHAKQRIMRPSHYAETVWEAKKGHARRKGQAMDWVVMRNRLSALDARNKRMMEQVLTELARRIGFRLADGFSERVIYRELFLRGLTLLDAFELNEDLMEGKTVTMSHLTARQEVRSLIATLRLAPPIERPPRPPGGVVPTGKLEHASVDPRFDPALQNADANVELPAWTAMMGDDDSHG